MKNSPFVGRLRQWSVESANDVEWSTVDDTPAAWSALGELYRFLTGLLLGMVTRVGVEPPPRCLPNLQKSAPRSVQAGARKLGLTDEPDAVACAKYHVLELSRWSARGGP